MNEIELLKLSLALKALYVAVALGVMFPAVVWASAHLDKRALKQGKAFREIYTRMAEDPRSLAVYHGCRILGMFVAAGLAIGLALG